MEKELYVSNITETITPAQIFSEKPFPEYACPECGGEVREILHREDLAFKGYLIQGAKTFPCYGSEYLSTNQFVCIDGKCANEREMSVEHLMKVSAGESIKNTVKRVVETVGGRTNA